MQAIVLYHQNKRDESLQLLKKAEAELSELKVDDGSLMMLIELGMFTIDLLDFKVVFIAFKLIFVYCTVFCRVLSRGSENWSKSNKW